MFNQEMTTTIDKQSLLQKLEDNRKTHKQIVEESRNGYIEKAKEALEKKLEELRQGKIVSLAFSLHPPLDNTKEYDIAIEMVKAHTENTMTLTSAQFRTLYMDEWEWRDQFLVRNSSYSATAASTLGE